MFIIIFVICTLVMGAQNNPKLDHVSIESNILRTPYGTLRKLSIRDVQFLMAAGNIPHSTWPSQGQRATTMAQCRTSCLALEKRQSAQGVLTHRWRFLKMGVYTSKSSIVFLALPDNEPSSHWGFPISGNLPILSLRDSNNYGLCYLEHLITN